ncbi:helix-turn-helix domain-containing protein [Streptomyces melanogenes]|uniref:helix-turn-helix domain-containing protein n=1 Tax=Streptomyces melanogenes TaxID=67326 RepID=UPI0037A89696
MERFEGGQKNPEIAAALRIIVRSVERWRRAWREGGSRASCRRGRREELGSVRPR